jgi:hypothetical protein
VIPTTTAGLLLFLAAVAPGYTYQRLTERRLERPERSAWLQAVDLLCIGATCTILAIVVMLAIGELLPDEFVNLGRLTGSAGDLRANPWLPARSGLLTLLLSNAIALALALLVIRLAPGATFSHGSVWTSTFVRYQGSEPDGDRRGVTLYVVAQLDDGRSIGGQLLFSERGNDADTRDIALAAPLWVSEPASQTRIPLSYEFVILKDRSISSLWGRRVALPGGATPIAGSKVGQCAQEDRSASESSDADPVDAPKPAGQDACGAPVAARVEEADAKSAGNEVEPEPTQSSIESVRREHG